MDHALPMPRLVDRRRMVALVLAGATGVACAEAGIAVMPWDGPGLELDSVSRTLTALAQTYDSLGPQKVAAHVAATETTMRRVFMAGTLSPKAGRDAAVLYAKLVTMRATAAIGTGHYERAARGGEHAASVALEVGDTRAAAHAWGVVSSALRNAGQPRQALVAAHRGRSYAGESPATAMLLIEESFAGTKFSRISPETIFDCVRAAEDEHARLTPDQWGSPGYPLGTYHPGAVKAHAGWALAQVGLYSQAAPRLEEAADLLAGTDGLKKAFVRMTQADVALATGDVDTAHDYATVAVASVETRPEVWVTRHVQRLDERSGGAFADLVEQTSRWEFDAV